MSDFWTDDRVTELRAHFAAGLYASQIAMEFRAKYRVTLSRNAVIGKLHRLGMMKNHRPPTEVRPPKPKRQTRARPFPFGVAKKPLHAPQEPVAPPLDAQAEPCSLLELTNERCRWPEGEVGQPGFHFCGARGADLSEGRAYCSAHMRMAAP